MSMAKEDDDESGYLGLRTKILPANFGIKNTLVFSSLRHNNGSTVSSFEEALVSAVHHVDGVLRHVLVPALVIVAMHFYVPLAVQRLQSWSNHVYLLVNLDLLNGLIIREEILLELDAIFNAD
jgi:hypothetical protein